MKRMIYTGLVFVALLGLSYNIYAITNPSEKHAFKSSEREVNFEPERGQGEVILHLQSAYFSAYDQIMIERSSGDIAGFATCKTLDIAQLKIEGDYYRTADKFPLSARTDSYYRIKVISKDGSMKTFPPVLVPALH